MNKTLLKNIIGLIVIVSGAFSANAAVGDAADWYFSAECNSWAVNESTQFKTTETDGVFILKDYTIAGSTGYKITNLAWSTYYGWADGGSVTETGVAYPLAENVTGNGWCGLTGGTYDITFNQTEQTIMFELSENQQEIDEGDIWYITGVFNNWALDASLQFVKSETDADVFKLDAFTLPESAVAEGWWSFVITTAGWAAQYVCAENVDNLNTEYEFVTRADNALAYSHLGAGEYVLEWNKKNHTLKIVQGDDSAIDDIVSDSATDKEYYSISGIKVNASNLTPGIYVVKEGAKTYKVRIK